MIDPLAAIGIILGVSIGGGGFFMLLVWPIGSGIRAAKKDFNAAGERFDAAARRFDAVMLEWKRTTP